jgi:membrane-bound metal-dependent hydrolase YbcI (DUF457 family)
MGITIALSTKRPRFVQAPVFFMGVVLLASFPDLDLIPGWFMGDAARFHWGPTHSLAACVLAGLVVGAIFWKWRGDFLRPALIASVTWGSHLLLDSLLGPVRGAPFGLELYWPFSPRRVMLPWSVFLLYPGDAIRENPLTALLHARVWPLVARELLVLGPFAVAALLIRIARVRGVIPFSLPHREADRSGTAADA